METQRTTETRAFLCVSDDKREFSVISQAVHTLTTACQGRGR